MFVETVSVKEMLLPVSFLLYFFWGGGDVWMLSVCLTHNFNRFYSFIAHSVSLHLFTASLFQAEKIIMILQLFRVSALDRRGEEVIL